MDMGKMSAAKQNNASLGIMQKSQLIECIRHKPCIWDSHHNEFKSHSARAEAFNEIAALLSNEQHKYSRSQIQEEWGKIRYCFVRIMKKVVSTKDESEAVSWPYWTKMRFMYDSVKELLLNNDSTSTNGNCVGGNTGSLVCGQKRSESSEFRNTTPDIAMGLKGTMMQLSPNSMMVNSVLSAIAGNPSSTASFASQQMTTHQNSRSVFDDMANHNDVIKRETDNTVVDCGENGNSTRSKRRKCTVEINEAPLNEASNRRFIPNSDEPTHSQSPAMPTTAKTRNGTLKESSKLVMENGDSSADEEINEYFGRYMIRQMQAVTKRNSTLGIHLRKELMEVCCKYELQISE